LTHITDRLGRQYRFNAAERDGMIRGRLDDGGHSAIARVRYDLGQHMIVSLWVEPSHRRRGLARAIVKSLWARFPKAVGRYPALPMSAEMHGFLTGLMVSEELPHCVPASHLRRKPGDR
jgi:GNAT superfamily N-acetyltransferase